MRLTASQFLRLIDAALERGEVPASEVPRLLRDLGDRANRQPHYLKALAYRAIARAVKYTSKG